MFAMQAYHKYFILQDSTERQPRHHFAKPLYSDMLPSRIPTAEAYKKKTARYEKNLHINSLPPDILVRILEYAFPYEFTDEGFTKSNVVKTVCNHWKTCIEGNFKKFQAIQRRARYLGNVTFKICYHINFLKLKLNQIIRYHSATLCQVSSFFDCPPLRPS